MPGTDLAVFLPGLVLGLGLGVRWIQPEDAAPSFTFASTQSSNSLCAAARVHDQHLAGRAGLDRLALRMPAPFERADLAQILARRDVAQAVLEQANALNTQTLEQLAACLQDLSNDDHLHVAVLAGRGKAFCGGADVEELSRLTESSARPFIERIHYVCAAIRRLPVPVVARLHGAVIGAGLEIAVSCDLRVAAEGTRFSMPEVRLGIPSVVEAALLPRLIGSGRAAWMVLTGEAIDARRAYEWGLIEEISADGKDVEQKLLAAEPEALKTQKQLLQIWEEAPLATSISASIEHFARCYASGIPGKRMRGILARQRG